MSIIPPADVTQAQDVFGNSVATVSFSGLTDLLLIDSRTEVILQGDPWPIFPVSASGASYPFTYSNDDRLDLGALLATQYPDPVHRLQRWAKALVHGYPTDTLSLLKDLNEAVPSAIKYESRDDEGTYSPVQTLELGRGSCRDLAVLFTEAARCLGFGARIVSGYLRNTDPDIVGSASRGTTHAWSEVFVPGAGWIAFDPTNRAVGDLNLIPVAVARDIGQAMPVSGSFSGPPDAFNGMSVEVSVD